MSLKRNHRFDNPSGASALATVISGYRDSCVVENRIAIPMEPRCSTRCSLGKSAKPSCS
jgi:hypothetical protein